MRTPTSVFLAASLTVGALLAAVLPGSAVAAPATSRASAAKPDVTITLVTHDSFAVSKSVLRAFTRASGVHVKVLPAGDAGAALNQAILTKDEPLGDVFFGVDNTFLSRALRAGIFEPYSSPELADVPAEFQLDPRHAVTPVDHGDVCINDDLGWFKDHHLAPPTTLEDLVKPRYRGLLVVENPATSSPGLAFLLATVAHFGEKGWRTYWDKLRSNDVQVVTGWEQAYNGAFTAGEGTSGSRPLVVSYASSPPAAVYYADPRPSTSPVGTLLASCFRQVEMAGILKGTTHERAARELIDFMLSKRFQADVPLQMFVFPVRDGTPLPAVFTKFAEVPSNPLSLNAKKIGQNRERWISEWTSTVLR
jgi:thiamine transport system substrate-binding protein